MASITFNKSKYNPKRIYVYIDQDGDLGWEWESEFTEGGSRFDPVKITKLLDTFESGEELDKKINNKSGTYKERAQKVDEYYSKHCSSPRLVFGTKQFSNAMNEIRQFASE